MSIYPWQSEIWQRLHEARTRLPHALLLHGRTGIGKLDFALCLIKALLCQSPKPDGQACDICLSCNWFLQNNHPDYRLLTLEQDGDDGAAASAKKVTKKSQILVAQIRELSSFFGLSSHRADGLRIVLAHPAEALNASAANALLKMLEEPPAGVIFILVSHQPQRLLPTITSRCQKIGMPIPSTAVALEWLKQNGVKEPAALLGYAGGSPLTAIKKVEESNQPANDVIKLLSNGKKMDPFETASRSIAHGMESATDALQKWVYDLLACTLTGEVRYHIQHTIALQALAKSVNLGLLLDLQRKLDEAQESAAHPLNNELQLESLLLQYTNIFSI